MCISVGEIIQIVVGGITAVALLFTGLSYFLSRKSYEKQYEYNRKKKALEIADEMAKLISTDITYVLRPFNELTGKEFFDNYFKATDSMVFDYRSICELIRKPEFSKYTKPDDVINQYLKCIEDYFNSANSSIVGKSDRDKKVRDETSKFLHLQNITMNRIEAISMYLYLDIADELVVYPSIHQMFLKFVKISSIVIAFSNKSSLDEYYKYTIKMYHKWNKRQIEHTKEVENKSNNQKDNEIERNKFIK